MISSEDLSCPALTLLPWLSSVPTTPLRAPLFDTTPPSTPPMRHAVPLYRPLRNPRTLSRERNTLHSLPSLCPLRLCVQPIFIFLLRCRIRRSPSAPPSDSRPRTVRSAECSPPGILPSLRSRISLFSTIRKLFNASRFKNKSSSIFSPNSKIAKLSGPSAPCPK